MKWHIRRVHACSAVTSHLPFRQNDWDFVRATAVTRGFRRDQNRYLARRQKCLQTSNTAAFFLNVIIQSGKQQTYFMGVLKTRSKVRTHKNTLQNRRQEGEKLKEGRQIEDSIEKDGKKEKLNWKGEENKENKETQQSSEDFPTQLKTDLLIIFFPGGRNHRGLPK